MSFLMPPDNRAIKGVCVLADGGVAHRPDWRQSGRYSCYHVESSLSFTSVAVQAANEVSLKTVTTAQAIALRRLDT